MELEACGALRPGASGPGARHRASVAFCGTEVPPPTICAHMLHCPVLRAPSGQRRDAPHQTPGAGRRLHAGGGAGAGEGGVGGSRVAHAITVIGCAAWRVGDSARAGSGTGDGGVRGRRRSQVWMGAGWTGDASMASRGAARGISTLAVRELGC